MFPTQTPQTPGDGRAVKPRVYMLPVVRPVPPRPAGNAVRTW
jgi:hypothetical protein